jgi:transcriptional regulator of NAD metabolism
MNYKFDNLNDKIPRGRKIHSKLEIIYRKQTEKESKSSRRRLQHHALIRRVTHSHYVIPLLAAWSRPHDAEIIDNKLRPRQKKDQNGDLNHKNMIY